MKLETDRQTHPNIPVSTYIPTRPPSALPTSSPSRISNLTLSASTNPLPTPPSTGASCSEVDDWSSEAVPLDPNSSSGTHEASAGGASCRQEARALSRARITSSTSYRVRHSRYCGCSSGSTDEVTMVEAKVIYATSHDPNYPPGAMLDGRHDTFWATGGLYPQVIVVTLPSVTSVENVTFTAYNSEYRKC
ncbi:uncharacterized protein LOC122261660 [Penaeus japonicus]|uniref:uncharacterized protein LOC122261660 n=1 Tax=Penaeus japonicus TaxID=27405 RepID=UPI001C70BD3A|nr:uncharacterized protein LOC122261660 [Penaeus japonicus]